MTVGDAQRGALPPLVGRDEELRVLGRALADVRDGDGRAIAALGEPGIGKTRLLGELRERAAAAGFAVLAAHASECERDVPYGLAVEALDGPLGTLAPIRLARLGDERVAELRAVLPALAGSSRSLATRLVVERYRFHEAAAAALEQLAEERAVLLTFDDVHWADAPSLELVMYLLRHPVRHVLLALACRPSQAPHQLLNALGRANQERSAQSIELAPLSLEHAAALVGDRVPEPHVELVHREAGGNPLYLEQLAAAWSHGWDRSATGREPPPLGAEIPATVQSVITHELERLSGPALALLRAIALLSEPVDLELALDVAALHPRHGHAAMDELIAADLVRPAELPHQFAFRHPIVRRVVYATTGPGWRLDAHRRAADVLQRRNAPIAARAHHVERSATVGDERAVALLTEAGAGAEARSPEAAAHWYEGAIRLLPGDAGAEWRLGLMIPLATALARAGRLRESRELLVDATGLFPPGMTEGELRVTSMLARIEQGLGKVEEARRLLDRALARVELDSAEAVALKLEIVENRMIAGEWSAAVAIAAEADELTHRLGDRTLQAVAPAWVARAESALADPERALATIDAAARGIDRLSDDALAPHLSALLHLGYAELSADRLGAATSHLARGAELARATGQGLLLVRLTIVRAIAAIRAGRLDAAEEAADAGVEGARSLQNDQFLAAALATRCWVSSERGKLEAALSAGAEAAEAATRATGSKLTWLAHVSFGTALVAAGQADAGRGEILRAGGVELTDVPPRYRSCWQRVLVVAEIEAGRLDAAEAVAETLARGVAATPTPHASKLGDVAYARACLLLAHGAADEAVTRAHEAAEHFEANELALDAVAARALAGRALIEAGEPAGARAELEHALASSDRLGAQRLWDRVAKDLRRLGARPARRPRIEPGVLRQLLTDRQLEIAERVASGYTNRAIANEIHVSPKTVEAHLTKIFAALGVSSRAAVAAAIERSRPHGADGHDAARGQR
jgi:ATP/maltotriose-dependent transcriptional regulator MalT